MYSRVHVWLPIFCDALPYLVYVYTACTSQTLTYRRLLADIYGEIPPAAQAMAYRIKRQVSKETVVLRRWEYYLALINRARGLYGRILTEVVSTDRTQ